MLIGLYSSYPQSGKSTVAKLIREGWPASIIPMAAPLKLFAGSLLGQVGADAAYHLYNNKNIPIDQLPGRPTGRHLLQSLGTDWGRGMISPELWTTLWQGCYDRHRGDPYGSKIVIVDDVRFPDEFRKIKSNGGVMWKISRPHHYERSLHASEGALNLFGFDAEIINDGGLEPLALQIDELIDTSHRREIG